MTEMLTFRDSIKTACLSHLIHQGYNEDEMVTILKKGTELLHKENTGTSLQKTARLDDIIANAASNVASYVNKSNAGTIFGALAALGIMPVVTSPSSSIGYTLGKLAKRIYDGQAPDPSDLHEEDRIREYIANAKEIEERIKNNKEKRKLMEKASVRRMF